MCSRIRKVLINPRRLESRALPALLCQHCHRVFGRFLVEFCVAWRGIWDDRYNCGLNMKSSEALGWMCRLSWGVSVLEWWQDPGHQDSLCSGCGFDINLLGFRGRVLVQLHQFPSLVYHVIHKCVCWISTVMRERGMWAFCFECQTVLSEDSPDFGVVSMF